MADHSLPNGRSGAVALVPVGFDDRLSREVEELSEETGVKKASNPPRDGGLGVTALRIAAAKAALALGEAFFRGIMNNVLVCIAIWVALTTPTIGGKIAARALIIIPPASFRPEVAGPLQNMALRAQTHIDGPVLGGFMSRPPP